MNIKTGLPEFNNVQSATQFSSNGKHDGSEITDYNSLHILLYLDKMRSQLLKRWLGRLIAGLISGFRVDVDEIWALLRYIPEERRSHCRLLNLLLAKV
jgi:hypothetical protein